MIYAGFQIGIGILLFVVCLFVIYVVGLVFCMIGALIYDTCYGKGAREARIEWEKELKRRKEGTQC